MAEDLFGFAWYVHKEGYAWIRTREVLNGEKERRGIYLAEDSTRSGKDERERYQPLRDHSGLFRTFAETEPTKEGILGFANRHGQLGGKGVVNIVLPRVGRSEPIGSGEPLAMWRREIMAMHQALDMWDMADRGEVGGLSRIISWRGRKIVLCDYNSHGQRDRYVIASPEIHPELLERFRPGDVIQPALCYVQYMVNKQLNGRVSPRLLWESDRNSLGLYINPTNLLGMLWLQLARAISEDKEYRRCKECRKWFEISPDVARINRQYCSNACRSRALRERQAEAKKLARNKVPVRKIAKRLNSDVKTVKGWIEGSRETARRE